MLVGEIQDKTFAAFRPRQVRPELLKAGLQGHINRQKYKNQKLLFNVYTLSCIFVRAKKFAIEKYCSAGLLVCWFSLQSSVHL